MAASLSAADAARRFRQGLGTKCRVIGALMRRETVTRFGRNRLGYLWALIEPIAFVALFVMIRNAIHASIPFGTSMLLFLVTGLVSFRVWRAIAGRTTPAISSNRSLLAYPMVRPLDGIFARIVLESLTMIVVLVIFYGFLTAVEPARVIVRPAEFTAAIIVTLYLGAAVGCFNAVFTVLSPTWQRIWGILSFPLLIMSGIFYVPALLPPSAQAILSWNPILHCIEWFRIAIYIDYQTLLDRPYPIEFATATFAIALAAERLYRNRLLQP